ncbi:Protein kinase domain-containing protein [Mycena kentingensis (nom. inval.)]|nr:Protein kinase domain-containing protein [Mycena kentingensis (nom. inval.)]
MASDDDDYYFEQLHEKEVYWRDRYAWLVECGYQLRPRFRPGWKPSWASGGANEGEMPFSCEDSWVPLYRSIMDARRLSDGKNVVLKKVEKAKHPAEVQITEFLTSLGENPQNHCIPVLETLHPPNEPDIVILVLALVRRVDSPPFETFGEAVEMFRQIFEAVQFLHHHNVAHRDLHSLNIGMDGSHLYAGGFHPAIHHQDRRPDARDSIFLFRRNAKHTTRTWKPVKYYLVDFGISRRYTDAQREHYIHEPIIVGGDRAAPEYAPGVVTADPFPIDIWTIAHFIHMDFISGSDYDKSKVGYRGFEFMEPLLADMMKEEQGDRPTIDEVVERFAEIQKGLSSWKLRSRLVGKREWRFWPHRIIAHWVRRIGYVLFRRPALPVPSK